MRVGIFNGGDIGSPHLETHLELAMDHKEKGDAVFFFACNAGIFACHRNPRHNLSVCAECIARRHAGVKLIPQGTMQELPLLNLTTADKTRIANLPTHFATIEDLWNFKLEGFQIGQSIIAAMIGTTRDPVMDILKYPRWIEYSVLDCASSYFSTLNWIKRFSLDVTYVQCARGGFHRSVLQASQKAGVECRVHERGLANKTYSLWPNTWPHDIKTISRLIEKSWSEADPLKREEQGEVYYRGRAEGQGFGWFSFVTEQEKGKLPNNWNRSATNVIIFTSSEDEISGLEEYKTSLYPNSAEGIDRIAKDLFRRSPNHHLYVRMHPNMRGIESRLITEHRNLLGPNLTIIPPESDISSYALLFGSEKVLTFGSGMGIEAVYWGKPSILVCPAFYQDMGVVYRPTSHTAVIDLLCQKLDPKPKIPALKYGYFFSTYGVPYKRYQEESPIKGTLFGVNLETKMTWGRRLLDVTFRIKGGHLLARGLGSLQRSYLKMRLRSYRDSKWHNGKSDGIHHDTEPQAEPRTRAIR